MNGFPRPGTCIVDPSDADHWMRPLAVGYVSSATGSGIEPGAWTRWHAAVEAHALAQQLSMLHVYSDEYRGDPVTGTAGLARMVEAMRELAHLRSGYVGVVIVPSLEHLSPARDGSESSTAALLSLHFGVTVQTAPPNGTDTKPAFGTAAGVGLPDQARVDRLSRGLAFGELLHGLQGDPDRVWTPPRTPAGPR